MNSPFKSREDVYEFLSQYSYGKPNSDRVYAYLDVFGIKESFDEIEKLFQSKIAEFKIDINNPLDSLSTEYVIRADIPRIMPFFDSASKTLKIEQSTFQSKFSEDSFIILSLLEKSGIPYLQGYDRYLTLLYLLSNSFSYPVSLTFRLMQGFISLLNPERYIVDQKYFVERYEEIDVLISKLYPQIYKVLEKYDFGSQSFGFKWEFVLFADIHPPEETLLIWDHILIHKNELDLFKKWLVISHLIYLTPENFTIELHTFRRYDTISLIKFADVLLRNKEETVVKKDLIDLSKLKLYLFIIFFLIFVYFYFKRSKS